MGDSYDDYSCRHELKHAAQEVARERSDFEKILGGENDLLLSEAVYITTDRDVLETQTWVYPSGVASRLYSAITPESEAALRNLLNKREAERRFEWVFKDSTSNGKTWELMRKFNGDRVGYGFDAGDGSPECGVFGLGTHWQPPYDPMDAVYGGVMCANWLEERDDG